MTLAAPTVKPGSLSTTQCGDARGRGTPRVQRHVEMAATTCPLTPLPSRLLLSAIELSCKAGGISRGSRDGSECSLGEVLWRRDEGWWGWGAERHFRDA